MKSRILVCIAISLLSFAAFAQQVPDTDFARTIPAPMYKIGSGPAKRELQYREFVADLLIIAREIKDGSKAGRA